MKRALMILIFLRTFVSDKQKILLVGRPTTAKSLLKFTARSILKFMKINDDKLLDQKCKGG